MTIQLSVALLVLINLFMLGSARIVGLIRAVAGQAFLLCLLAVLVQKEKFEWYDWILIAITILIKSAVLPTLLRRALRDTVARRDIEPIIGYSYSLLLGLVLLSISLWIAWRIPLPGAGNSPLVIAVTFFTISTGLLLVVSRNKALTQVIGYLTMENGIYGLGLAAATTSPLIVEMGILLDVLVGIFIMGIVILHISREFDHIDTRKLVVLRD